ncbi:MAG: AcrR family transcriptional regulator [Flavobacteriales bacterium]
MNTQDKSYHHGNLKEALVAGFLELLLELPLEKISLRKLASHLGVAPTAAYNHFKKKEELIVAVKQQCLQHFADFLDLHSSDKPNATETIQALGQAYFQYSILHRSYFSFLMTDNVPEEYVSEALVAASMKAEGSLRSAIKRLLEENNLPATQYNEGLGTFACWSLTHGVTQLAAKHMNHAACLEGRWPPEFMLSDTEQIHSSFAALTQIITQGLLVAARP